MKIHYTTIQLSERISETPEGFLLCESVPITRTGDLVYTAAEMPEIEPGADGFIRATRTAADIHDPQTVASFEGKPVTIRHPVDFVTPENWKELAVGVIQNVRPGTGEDAELLLADLLITDIVGVDLIKSKQLREVSCGYENGFTQVSPGHARQHTIRGNHVALVDAGRCGAACAIHDHKERTMKDKLLAIFGRAVDKAIPEIEADEETVVNEEKSQDEKPEEVPEEKSFDAVEERFKKLEDGLKAITDALAEMKKSKDAMPVLDADMALAEILAPGITMSDDVKQVALDTAYKTTDGKMVIDTLLAGREYAYDDTLFIAAAELVKAGRRQKMATTLDNFPAMKPGVMTPEKMNEINAGIYGKK